MYAIRVRVVIVLRTQPALTNSGSQLREGESFDRKRGRKRWGWPRATDSVFQTERAIASWLARNAASLIALLCMWAAAISQTAANLRAAEVLECRVTSP